MATCPVNAPDINAVKIGQINTGINHTEVTLPAVEAVTKNPSITLEQAVKGIREMALE